MRRERNSKAICFFCSRCACRNGVTVSRYANALRRISLSRSLLTSSGERESKSLNPIRRLLFSRCGGSEVSISIPSLFLRQNLRPIFCYQNRVLRVCGARTILRAVGMAVFVHVELAAAQRHHRLDGDDEAFYEFFSASGCPEIRYVRLFVYFKADAVAGEVARESEPVLLGDALDRIADVACGIAHFRLCDSSCERFVRAANQLFIFRTVLLARDNGDCVIGEKTVVLDAKIEAHDIALLYHGAVVTRRRMHDDVVDRETEPRRIAMLLLPALVAEERERIGVGSDQLMRFLFKLAGGTTRHDHFRKDAQMPRQALSAFAKLCDLFLGGRYHTHPVQKIRLRIFLKSEYRKNAFVNGCNVGFAVYFADGPSAFPKPCYRKHHVLFVPRKTAVQSLVGRGGRPSPPHFNFFFQ